jgi:ribosomal protein S18 acetylase RimI-like enzyme
MLAARPGLAATGNVLPTFDHIETRGTLVPSPDVVSDPLRVRSSGHELRRAGSADAELLFRVYASTRAEELAALDWPPATMEVFLRQQFDAQDRHYRQSYPEASFDLIIVDGQRAGRLYLDRTADETRIVDIALLPEFRGRGVGTRVVGDVMAAACRRDASVTIHVERTNPALSWYQRLGFQMEEDRGVYLFLRWRPPGEVL